MKFKDILGWILLVGGIITGGLMIFLILKTLGVF